VTWRTLKLGREDALAGVDGWPSGLAIEPVAVPGKPPIHLENRPGGRTATEPEDNVGLRISETATGRRLAYFPAAGGVTPAVREALADADCVFFDGTFWSSDELPAQGLGTKRAADMAHLPIGGRDGSLAALREIRAARRILIHLNNTNPVLRDAAPARGDAGDEGRNVAWG